MDKINISEVDFNINSHSFQRIYLSSLSIRIAFLLTSHFKNELG